MNEHLNVREARQHPFSRDSEYFTAPQAELCFEPLPEGASVGTTDAVEDLQMTLEAYHRAMQALAHKVERCFALALGLEEDYIVNRCSKAPIWPVTVAHYPAQPEAPPPGVMRINPHWDRDLFALVTSNNALAQVHGCGIQILLDDDGNTLDASSGRAGKWCDVPLKKGMFTVNIGECMTRWTNGSFPTIPEFSTGKRGKTWGFTPGFLDFLLKGRDFGEIRAFQARRPPGP